jgi:hypothetical protein
MLDYDMCIYAYIYIICIHIMWHVGDGMKIVILCYWHIWHMLCYIFKCEVRGPRIISIFDDV